MRYQKVFMNILVIFLLFFIVSSQANDLSKKAETASESAENEVKMRGNDVSTRGIKFLNEISKEFTEYVSAYGDTISAVGGIPEKIKPLLEGYVGYVEAAGHLDKFNTGINIAESIKKEEYNRVAEHIVNDQLSGYASAIGPAVLGAAGFSNPYILVGSALVGSAVHIKSQPYIHKLFTKDPATIAFEKSKKFFQVCNISEVFSQADIALKLATDEKKIRRDIFKKKLYEADEYKSSHYNHLSPYGRGNTPQDIELSYMRDRQDYAKKDLDYTTKLIADIKKLRKDCSKKSDLIDQERRSYKKLLSKISTNSNLKSRCEDFSFTKNILNRSMNDECKIRFLASGNPSLKKQTEDLFIKINSDAHQLSSNRWKTLDDINKSLAACTTLYDIPERLSSVENIIRKNPIYIINEQSECQQVEQSKFLHELDIVSNEFYAKKKKCESVGFWRRSAGEVIKGEFISRRKYCWGDVEVIKRLSEGKFSSRHYAHHPSCPGQINLKANISFDPPPPKIAAGDTVYLKSSGSKHGYQTCCFLTDWFQYKGSCFSSKPKDYVSLDLRSKYKKPVPISIPGIKKAKGLQGSVDDNSTIALTMPKRGKTCTVIGHTNRGLYIKWTYTYEKASTEN